jgi:hypothetical protein
MPHYEDDLDDPIIRAAMDRRAQARADIIPAADRFHAELRDKIPPKPESADYWERDRLARLQQSKTTLPLRRTRS